MLLLLPHVSGGVARLHLPHVSAGDLPQVIHLQALGPLEHDYLFLHWRFEDLLNWQTFDLLDNIGF